MLMVFDCKARKNQRLGRSHRRSVAAHLAAESILEPRLSVMSDVVSRTQHEVHESAFMTYNAVQLAQANVIDCSGSGHITSVIPS